MTILVEEGFLWLEESGGPLLKITPTIELNDSRAREVCSFLGELHPVFAEEVLELDELYKPFCPALSEFSKGVILFPGSFSPWHKGHEACALAQRQTPVVIIPDFNPWKKLREDSIWSELKSLWNFSRGNSGVSVFPGFLAMNEKNPTVSWLPKLSIDEKWLLMGDDSFLSLDKWKDSQLLITSLKGVLVCPRLGDQDALNRQAVQLKEHSELEVRFLPPHDFQQLSSTKIRQKG